MKSPALGRALLIWYDANHRALPWRKTRDPYRIWISEIMLQQTRVATIIQRYQQFLLRFPTVQKLAAARESSVLAEWTGLGYYRRARNLHAAAKIIAREKEFPLTAELLLTLPGIGRYTAAAIASIAFNEPVAVVDGNVERVLSRVLGATAPGPRGDLTINKNDVIPSRKAARNLLLAGSAHADAPRNRTHPDLWDEAQSFLDPLRPGDSNQAMMELGATICLPRRPQCHICPIRKFCRTRGPGNSKPVRLRQRKKEITYSLDRRAGSILLVRRSRRETLMPGMWELPETSAPQSGETLFTLRHSITVTNYTVRVVRARVARTRPERSRMGPSPANAGTLTRSRWIKTSRLATLPLTGLAQKILRTAKIIQ